MPEKNPAGSPTPANPEWADPDDAPELTEALLADAELFDGDAHVRRGRGRPRLGAAKQQISVRLDPDVLARLRAAGPGWQSQINGLLRHSLGLVQDASNAPPAKAEFYG
jgi:uncharacterized protein (DUF4415 family)